MFRLLDTGFNNSYNPVKTTSDLSSVWGWVTGEDVIMDSPASRPSLRSAWFDIDSWPLNLSAVLAGSVHKQNKIWVRLCIPAVQCWGCFPFCWEFCGARTCSCPWWWGDGAFLGVWNSDSEYVSPLAMINKSRIASVSPGRFRLQQYPLSLHELS